MIGFWKNLAAIGAALLATAPAYAIPATPFPVKVTQPDGTELTLSLRGDEHGAIMLTTDGYAVVQDNRTGRYEFADVANGTLVTLGIAASNPEARSAETMRILAGIDKEAVLTFLDSSRTASQARKRPPHKIKISNYPTLGHQKALVILVEFANTKFTTMEDPYAYYNGLLNEEGFTWDNGADGSARDFYLASSDGKFDPEFTVVGPVVLEKNSEYYGGDGTYIDENVVDMILEAATLADEIVDYNDYDADGDGFVDNIYFFYAGAGQADSGIPSAVWPHSGEVEGSWGKELILDDIRINRYACSNEVRGGSGPHYKPVGIGTFVHEFGHVLGIADHYDTAYKSGRTGVNQWDTMAGASYFNNQNTPPLFSAFERAELEWMEYTDISADTPGWLDLPCLDTESKAYRFVVDGTDGREYFILENRQKRGWDTYLPGHGMLVWHVDMDEERWWSNTINNDSKHQYLDLVEADGKENESTYTGDPFPGKNEVTTFSFKNWAGDQEFALDHIIEYPDHITLLLGDTGYVPETPELDILRVGGESVTFSWAPSQDAQRYHISLRDGEGNPHEIYGNAVFETPQTIEVRGLSPFTNYTLDVQAGVGSYLSETASHTFTTSDICFFETTPLFLEPSEIKDNGYTVDWEPLAGAEDYIVTIDELKYDEPVVAECDFSEVEAPFTTSSEKFNKALFGKKSPSLQLDADGAWMQFTTKGDRIESISFWVRSQSASNSIRLEGRDENGEWQLLEEQGLKTSGQTLTFEIPGSSAIRIVFVKGSGYMLIDDFKCTYSPLTWLEVEDYQSVATEGECSFTARDLKSETTYRTALTAIADGDFSRTALLRVTTSDGSGVDSVSDAASRQLKARYDIFGRPVGDGYKGIAIERYSDGSSRKIKL